MASAKKYVFREAGPTLETSARRPRLHHDEHAAREARHQSAHRRAGLGSSYLRLPLLAGGHFAPQFVEEVFDEYDVILRLLRFFGFGCGHQRRNALAVG